MHPSLTSSSTHLHCRCLGFPFFPTLLFCLSPLLIPPCLCHTLSLLALSEFTDVPAEDLARAEILGMKTKVVSGEDKKRERGSFGQTSVPKEAERQMFAVSLPCDGRQGYLEDCS